MSGLFEDLSWRGLIYQLTHADALPSLLDRGGLTVYVGFDPTSDSLHIGSLLPLLMLARLQRAGHRAIALVGGATGFIGDPGGKSQERVLLSAEQLEHNLIGIRAQIERFIDLTPGRGLLLNNYDWLGSMSFIAFLRDVGKRVSVNSMLEKDSVRTRIESRDQGISYTEFSYMLMQGYDYQHLHQAQGCTLQMGGSDQWGNITLGMDLIRRTSGDETYGLTWPLLTRSDGAKFGKSEQGNVWLDARYTSPYQFYQYFVRVADADVVKLLKQLTFLEREEIEALEAELETRPEARAAQLRLAELMTTLVRSEAETRRAQQASQALFGGSLEALDERTLLEVFAEAPGSTIGLQRLLSAGLPLVDLLAETGIAPSKGAARRDVTGGGIYLNNARATDRAITEHDLLLGRYLVLRKGKKHYHLVRGE